MHTSLIMITHGNSTLGPALPPALISFVDISIHSRCRHGSYLPPSRMTHSFAATMGTLQPLIWLSSVSETFDLQGSHNPYGDAGGHLGAGM